MKKENRKMAQQRRAEERRKKELRRKISKAFVIGIPSLAVLLLVAVLIADTIINKDTSSQTEDTSTESTSDTAQVDTNTDVTDSDSTTGSSGNASSDGNSTVYSADTSLTVADGNTVNIDYVGTVDGIEFDGGNTHGMGTDLTIGSGSYIDDFEEQLIGAHPGDTVEVNVTFPDTYGNNTDLSGKDAVFTVTLNGIYE